MEARTGAPYANMQPARRLLAAIIPWGGNGESGLDGATGSDRSGCLERWWRAVVHQEDWEHQDAAAI